MQNDALMHHEDFKGQQSITLASPFQTPLFPCVNQGIFIEIPCANQQSMRLALPFQTTLPYVNQYSQVDL